jgi:hypothetical protein
MANPRPLIALAAALCAVGFAAGAAPDPGGDEVVSAAPIHSDPRALENATLDAERAILRDDVVALTAALERVSSLARPIGQDETGRYEPVRTVDRGFHVGLDAALAAGRSGDLQGAVGQAYWVTVGCRKCHVEARKVGLLPNAPLLQDD